MSAELYISITVSAAVVLTLQLHSHFRHARQTKMMLIQSDEIKKQMKEMQQQNKLLQELNVEKQQIIGVVSHDLKGPFNRIFALVHLMTLSGEKLTEEQKEYLGKIHQIVADGLGMVRNLLDNRRFDDKGIELNLEKLDLSPLISSFVKNYNVLSQKKKIQMYFDAPPHVVILTDKMCITRIVDNLFSNALKFSPMQRNIFVSLLQQNGLVEIRVKDEGPGLSMDDKQKLFLKYQRLTPRPTGGESSTGLGLFLVNTMVTKLGGHVFCESELDKGATFVVRLPEAKRNKEEGVSN